MLHVLRRFTAPTPGWRLLSQQCKPDDAEPEPYECLIESPDEMDNLGASLAGLDNVPAAGDVIFLFGDVGVGKSHLARAFIRAALCDPDLAVPSPGYLLSQTYAVAKLHDDPLQRDELLDLVHVDLYRLDSKQAVQKSLHMLDIGRLFDEAATLIEWPQRLPKDKWPADRLEVHIHFAPEQPRVHNSDDDVAATSHQQAIAVEQAPRLVRLLPFGQVWQQRLRSHHDE